MPFYRYAEITMYALVNFLPCFLLAVYPFWQERRFDTASTVFGIFINTLIHVFVDILKYYSDDHGYLSFLCTLTHALFMLVWFKVHFGKTLFVLLMLTNISNFIISLSKCLEGLLFPALAIAYHRWSNVVTLVIVDIIVLLPMLSYFKHVFVKALDEKLKIVGWRYLWLIPLTFYSVWFRNFYFSAEGAVTLALRPRYILFTTVINAGAILIYTMISRMIQEEAENATLREREYHLTMQQTQYSILQERIDEARRAKHDMRQHLHVMAAYLKDGKYEELDSYLNRYEKSLPDTSTLSYCDNYAVNALLQYFASQAKAHNIGFSANVYLPVQAGIPDEALVVAMGNLIENAMDACISEGSGVVSVRGKWEDGAAFLRVVNTCSIPPRQDQDGQYLSRKREGHGIGLQSVHNIVEQYQGIMEADWDDGRFTVDIFLNIPTE